MPRIICFTSPKGGCGSTFVCSGLACSLTALGRKVLAVDMCFEKGTMDFLLGFQNDYVYTLADVRDGLCTLEESVVCHGDVSFVRGGYESREFSREFSTLISGEHFDYVLVDFPSYNMEIRDSITEVAQKLIIVTDPAHVSQKICDTYIDDTDFADMSVIVNKIKPSCIKAGVQMTVDEILDALSIPLLGLVPWSLSCDIMLKNGLTHGIVDESLDIAFSNIALRLEGENIPAMNFEKVYDPFKSGRLFTKGRT